ncbi:acetyltransferase [Billgrantia sp. LNSP4103-1]|uniref:acetyltransferase n=1 Tax=Billgrantia sp. LNSP4103-1 TaxID=3410266 RepID=UPI00403F1687
MSQGRRLAIFGASGHGKVVADIAIQSGWQELAFYDDAWPSRDSHEAWPILGTFAMLLHRLADFDGIVVAIGNNSVREAKLEVLLAQDAPIVTLIHPRATVSALAMLGVGSVVVAGGVINAFAKVGPGCIVNSNATVGHDCRLGSCVHVAPGANVAGGVTIGRLSWIGAGAVVRQGVALGSAVEVGVGAAVVRNIDDRLVVAGVPARPLLSSMEERPDEDALNAGDPDLVRFDPAPPQGEM